MEINTEFWRNKKVLITGHTGFKGGWLTVWLNMLGAKITGLSLSPVSEPSFFNCASVNNGIDSHIGDIRDYSLVKNLVTDTRPDIVFHLAAQSLVRHSYTHPIETFSTNVLGTVHMLEATHQAGDVRVFVNVTSDKCYLNEGHVKSYCENDSLGGNDPYSASKACAELVTHAMRASYFTNGDCKLASVRAGNVIGGGDWAKDRLIPDVVMAFLDDRKAVIRNPDAIRPWQFVLDPLFGYMLLAERLYESDENYSEGWNFGPGPDNERPVSELIDQFTRLWGNTPGCQFNNSTVTTLKEAQCLKLDSSKARKRLGWEPRWNLPYILEQTVDWYKAYSSGADMRKFTCDQIESYMQNEKYES